MLVLEVKSKSLRINVFMISGKQFSFLHTNHRVYETGKIAEKAV